MNRPSAGGGGGLLRQIPGKYFSHDIRLPSELIPNVDDFYVYFQWDKKVSCRLEQNMYTWLRCIDHNPMK